ncbi:glycoside hydrolase family 9 protein [Roseisolibacter agri]|uniref:Endoglucanase n=1 Tax=Roseisolibacter agri TaxID=2014610 RepID=A0AA37VAC0_9BACT|nr:glycoside hydrolase family 9 protein [Roseisolibacter agri]GLC25288.1 endoglucanase [Roseisolibacter agri]
MRPRLATLAVLALSPALADAQAPRSLMPIDFVESAEFGWLRKPVLASRVLDDMTRPDTWKVTGTAKATFPTEPRLGDMRVLRVDMQLFEGTPAPNRARLPAVNIQRAVPNEDWSGYNRISLWVRPDFRGVPVLPLQIALRNDGAEKVPERYGREGTHYVTLTRDGWQQIVWEIEPLARDRVTRLEIGYFVNKMLADPGDRVAFELGRLELQKVAPDHHTGWSVAPGRLAFSHSGYQTGASKTAVASGLAATDFQLLRVDDAALGQTVLRAPLQAVRARNGEFQLLDFSSVETPGRYVLQAGDVVSRPFDIGGDVWKTSLWKTLNFFYGNRCGDHIPGVHGIDHLDWLAAHGDQRLTMSGGWHDAGDLSQGVINTGESTYAMFALAERLAARGDDPALVERLLEEARWGLDWVLRVRFAGGYRIGFGSHNYWSNNVVGDADDKVVEAKNNPNANYIASAAGAIAARVLKDRDPALAARSLRIAEDDWEHAIVGVEGPSTWHTPAFAASRMELAGIGITASVELFRATGKARYRDKAVELARVVTGSQQVARVGRDFPLAGFWYTGPDRDTLFHQFHRAADQAPVVALAQLVEAFPDHPEWMRWYAAIARHAEFQKRAATTTAPYGVLPAYVYRVADSAHVPASGDRYMATPDQYAAQARAGLPMGDGWYLRAFPVWFQRRGNYGVLLSQAKALSAASRLRGDSAGLDLAQRQAQWVVGRNPFAQSTMYGEGHDWAQQYSVSSADFVGSLPVGMQSRGVTDLPYWPSQNMYVYKEVWVHPSARWLWLMADLLPGAPATSTDSTPTPVATAAANGDVTIRWTLATEGTHRVALRTDNLTVDRPTRTVTVQAGRPVTVEWKGRVRDGSASWTAVVVPDGDASRRREVVAP